VSDTLTESPQVHSNDSFELKEIIKPPHIAKAPGPDFFAGMIDHDGRKIPVIDLNLKFGLGATRCDGKTRILVVQFQGTEMGLLADDITLR